MLHPDIAGDESTAAFRQLYQAYEKLRSHILQSSESNDSTAARDFFSDNFEAFNFPYENQGSFTVKIEDALASAWNDTITKYLGIPLIKMNSRSTETDRYWKVNYKHGFHNIELTIHLYMKPKSKTGSKLLVQGSEQTVICAYVFYELPIIYKKVCELKVGRLALESKSKSKITKTLVKCDQCSFRSSILQMKVHIKSLHDKKQSKAKKRPSVLTPLPNPAKRVMSAPVPSLQHLDTDVTMNVSIMAAELKEAPVKTTATEEVVVLTNIHSCNVCSFESDNKHEFDLHIEKGVHQTVNEEKYHCEICNVFFTTTTNLDTHIIEKHTESIVDPSPNVGLIPCEVCDFHATSRIVLDDHMGSSHFSTHPPNTEEFTPVISVKQCSSCSFSSTEQDILEKHINDIHQTIRCKFCTFSSTNQLMFDDHVKEVHTRKNAVKCDNDNGICNNSECLLSSKYPCKLCGYKTERVEYLLTHINVSHKEIYGSAPPVNCDF